MQKHFLTAASLVLALAAACAGTAPVTQERPRAVGMSLREATALVDDFESKQVAPQKKLAAPTTSEEALAILKTDRLDAFPADIKWLETQEGYDATVLRAQTFLAWGEAELTVAEVLAQAADRLDEEIRGLQVRKLTPELNQKLEETESRSKLYRRTDEALRLLAAEHVAAGADDAKKAMEQKPDDYRGYRVAADAHRLRNEWPEFSAMVSKVEESNPDSVGLLFLRGVAAHLRDGDPREAIGFFRQALERDPQFVRAQAQLVLLQTSVFDQHKELEKLRAIAPDHQIVRWAGPMIDAAYAAAAARQEALQSTLGATKAAPGKAN